MSTRIAFTLAVLVTSTVVAQDARPKFARQQLKPTKAVVVRPPEWFYAESHRGTAFDWTISKEDTTGGKHYKTGVKIQAFFGVKDATTKTPEQFVKESIKQRKESPGVTVRQASDEVAVGPCKTLRLLTEEKGNVILHEYYYGTGDLDAAVVVIRGAPKDEWPKVRQQLKMVGRFNLQPVITAQSKVAAQVAVPKDDLTGPLTKLGYKAVEMKLEPSGMPVVQVRVNKSEPLRFVCDTGANATIISPEAARALKLTTIASNQTAAGLGGAKASMTASINELQLGDTATEWRTLMVTDISRLNKQFAVAGGKPVDGFLGSDWMRKHQAVVDVSRNRLFFKAGQ